MENIKPPKAKKDPNGPSKATSADIKELKTSSNILVLPPLATVASNFVRRCVGGDTYDNNCAHYLSNAFILAGYQELYNANPSINQRCGKARRPIRARDMWEWFQTKQVRSSRTPTKNTGWWAVFQLDERVYWGGHVVLLDSDKWIWHGTNWYNDWQQYLYQW